jgi:branched-chain amino acid transport system substrate-binding protein
MRKFFTPIVLLLALFSMSALACGDDEIDEENPFRIAVLKNITGYFGTFAASNLVGFEAAVDQINADGGILGRKVVYEVFDTQSDVPKGVEIINEVLLGSTKFHAIYPQSIGAAAVAPAINEAGIIAISNAGDTSLTDPATNPWTFDLPALAGVQGESIACMLTNLPHKKYAVLTGQGPFWDAHREAWDKMLPQLGLEITAVEVVPFGTPDMTAQMQKLQASEPDALLFDLFGQDILFAFQAMKNVGFNVPAIGGNSASTTDFGLVFTNINEEVPEGTILTAWDINVRQPDGLRPEQQELLDAIKARTTEINGVLYQYSFGYDVAMLIKYAAEKADSDDPQKMLEALEGLGAIDNQSEYGFMTSSRYDFSPTFHGLASVPLNSVIPGIPQDGFLDWGGIDWEFPCTN